MRKFFDSILFQWVLSRIGALEATVGAIPDPDGYSTIADVRAVTIYTDTDRVQCNENNYLYQFDAALTTADNGGTILTPDDITEPAPGRWVRLLEYSVVGHNHDTDYQKLITTPTQNRFLFVNASGQAIESAYTATSWVASSTYATFLAGAFADLQDQVDTLETAQGDYETDLENKMDVLAPTTGQENEILLTDAAGQAIMSGSKIADLAVKPVTITIPDNETGYTHNTARTTEPAVMPLKKADGILLNSPNQVDVTVTFNEGTGFWDINIISYIGELTDAKLFYI